MIRDVLASVAGIEIFPILSLLLFLAVFVGVLIRVTRLEDAFVQRMGALPLDDTSPEHDMSPAHRSSPEPRGTESTKGDSNRD